MEIIEWANKKGQLISLDKDEADELVYIIQKAIKQGVAESGFINTAVEVEPVRP